MGCPLTLPSGPSASLVYQAGHAVRDGTRCTTGGSLGTTTTRASATTTSSRRVRPRLLRGRLRAGARSLVSTPSRQRHFLCLETFAGKVFLKWCTQCHTWKNLKLFSPEDGPTEVRTFCHVCHQRQIFS